MRTSLRLRSALALLAISVAFLSPGRAGAWPVGWGGGGGGGSGTVTTSSPVSGNGSGGSPITISTGALNGSSLTAATVNLTKLSTQAPLTIVANATAGTASPTAVTLGAGLAFSAGTLINSAPISADETRQVNNSTPAAVTGLQTIVDLSTATASAEVGRLVWKQLSAGSLVTSMTLQPTLLTLGGTLKAGSNGTAGTPSISVAPGENTGLFRGFTSTLSFAVAGAAITHLNATGFYPAGSFTYSLDNGSGIYGLKIQNTFNPTIVIGSGNFQVGATGVNADAATSGWIDWPTTAGSMSATPGTTASGKMSCGIGNTSTTPAIKCFYGGAWHVFATGV